jgi:MFS family permease
MTPEIEPSDSTTSHLRLLGMRLTPGTSKLNVLSMFVLTFCLILMLYTKTGTLQYLMILRYGVSVEDVGEVSGNVNAAGAIFLTFFHFPVGALMDLVGRRIPILIGMLVAGGFLIGLTLGHNVYPDLYLMVIVLAVSGSPVESAPFLNDYIEPESFGQCQLLVSVV